MAVLTNEAWIGRRLSAPFGVTSLPKQLCTLLSPTDNWVPFAQFRQGSWTDRRVGHVRLLFSSISSSSPHHSIREALELWTASVNVGSSASGVSAFYAIACLSVLASRASGVGGGSSARPLSEDLSRLPTCYIHTPTYRLPTYLLPIYIRLLVIPITSLEKSPPMGFSFRRGFRCLFGRARRLCTCSSSLLLLALSS